MIIAQHRLLALIHKDPKQKATTLNDLMPFFNENKASEDKEDDGVESYLLNR